MTSIFKTPAGELNQFVQNLHTAGLSYEDVARVNRQPSLARAMYEAIQLAALLSWWRTPEQQLERARALWPDAVLPEPPASFVPQTETEVLLLHVPDTFDNLWDKVIAPSAYTKSRDGVKSDNKHLRLAPNKHEHTKPVWLGFDSEHGRGQRPDSFWGQSNLAASEVLSALIQFPDWPLEWFHCASAPNLAGYQLKYNKDWSFVPFIYRQDDGHKLDLRARWSGLVHVGWASPVIREC